MFGSPLLGGGGWGARALFSWNIKSPVRAQLLAWSCGTPCYEWMPTHYGLATHNRPEMSTNSWRVREPKSGGCASGSISPLWAEGRQSRPSWHSPDPGKGRPRLWLGAERGIFLFVSLWDCPSSLLGRPPRASGSWITEVFDADFMSIGTWHWSLLRYNDQWTTH